MEKNGVTLLVDPMSFQYLTGAEIDYKEDLEGPLDLLCSRFLHQLNTENSSGPLVALHHFSPLLYLHPEHFRQK